MDYYGEVVDVKEQYKIVGLGEVGVSSDDIPVLVTTNINTCVAVLLITKESAFMVHINFKDKNDYFRSLNDISSLLKNNNENINKIQMFLGGRTSIDDVEELKKLFSSNELNLEVYDSYLEFDAGSIAYDFKHDKYYGFDSDNNFRYYLLGANNKRKDPLEEFNSNDYGSI